MLAGKLLDDAGEPLTSSHARKGERRYRYYISKGLVTGKIKKGSGWRLPALTLERSVADIIAAHLSKLNPSDLLAPGFAAEELALVAAYQNSLHSYNAQNLEVILILLKRATLKRDNLGVQLNIEDLAQQLGMATDRIKEAALTFSAPLALKRRGVEIKFIVGGRSKEADPVLKRTLLQALNWKELMISGKKTTEIAKAEKRHARHIRNRIQLAFLSPRIMKAIADGTQPPHLSTESFVRTDIPLCWHEQEQMFGFEPNQPSTHSL